jgi:hypothetical protein
LRLTWSGFDLEFKSEKSTRTFKAEEFTPFETDSETEVFIKRPQREKQFQIGSRIELSPHDLNEICWAYQEKAKYLAGKFQEYARKIGIRETGP